MAQTSWGHHDSHLACVPGVSITASPAHFPGLGEATALGAVTETPIFNSSAREGAPWLWFLGGVLGKTLQLLRALVLH